MAEGGKKKEDKKKKKGKLPPGPRSLPVLGSLMSMRDDIPFHEDLIRLGKKHGPIFTLNLGGSKMIVLNEFDVMKEALVRKGKAFAGRPPDPRAKHYGPDYVPKGITDVNYSEEWKNQRSFSMQVLSSLGYGKNVVAQKITHEAEMLKQYILDHGSHPLDPTQALNVTVANVMCNLLIGERFDIDSQELVDLIQCVEDISDSENESTMGDYVGVASMSSSYRKALEKGAEAYDKLEKFFMEKCQSTHAKIKAGDITTPTNFIEGYILGFENQDETSEKKITENQVMNVAIDMFMAAAESTNVTLKWGILYMAHWPDVQKKIQQILDEKHQKQAHVFSIEERSDYPYLQATIMEIQRRSCVATTTLYHATVEDVDILEYTIPKDTAVVANLYSVMFNPEFFPEPNEFRTERFLDENGAVQRDEHWIPFGMGRRMCFGEQLAKQELFLFFSTLLYNFELLPEDPAAGVNIETDQKLVQKPKPFKLIFKPRI